LSIAGVEGEPTVVAWPVGGQDRPRVRTHSVGASGEGWAGLAAARRRSEEGRHEPAGLVVRDRHRVRRAGDQHYLASARARAAQRDGGPWSRLLSLMTPRTAPPAGGKRQQRGPRRPALAYRRHAQRDEGLSTKLVSEAIASSRSVSRSMPSARHF